MRIPGMFKNTDLKLAEITQWKCVQKLLHWWCTFHLSKDFWWYGMECEKVCCSEPCVWWTLKLVLFGRGTLQVCFIFCTDENTKSFKTYRWACFRVGKAQKRWTLLWPIPNMVNVWNDPPITSDQKDSLCVGSGLKLQRCRKQVYLVAGAKDVNCYEWPIGLFTHELN